MPKQTAKYSAACRKTQKLNISVGEHQEQLYQSLNSQGFYLEFKRENLGKT
jgi:hypothetical protein